MRVNQGVANPVPSWNPGTLLVRVRMGKWIIRMTERALRILWYDAEPVKVYAVAPDSTIGREFAATFEKWSGTSAADSRAPQKESA